MLNTMKVLKIWSQFADFILLPHRLSCILNPYGLQHCQNPMLDSFSLRPGKKPILNLYRLRRDQKYIYILIGCDLVKNPC